MSASCAEIRAIGAWDPLSEPALARDLGQKYFLFDAFVGGARRVELQPLVLPPALHGEAVHVAEETARIIGETGRLALEHDDEGARYKFSPGTRRLARASFRGGDDAALVRVDLLLGRDGHMHPCEVNADCPGGHNEALALPQLARSAGFMAGRNPTNVVQRATVRLEELARGRAVALLYATAYAEDLQVCALLQRSLRERGVRAVLSNPTGPRVRDGKILVGGDEIGVVYRFYPTEWMEGQRNLGAIAAAVESGALKSFSSFSHVYAQSKFAFARTFARRASLTRGEQAFCDRHLPETYDLLEADEARLVRERTGWVVKRAMGRVGDQVFVGELFAEGDWRTLVRSAMTGAAAGESWIAQAYVPQATVASPWGPRFVTLGAYVQDGTFAGYFARVTPESHVSHDAVCVPVFVDVDVSRASTRGAEA